MRSAILCLLALLAACDRPSGGSGSATAATARPASAQPAGCADSLTVELGRQSFSAAGLGSGEAELERWGRDSAVAFKGAAAQLCAQGRMAPADFAPFKHLLVQYGGGADSAAIWVDDARPAAIILQYAFYPGEPAPSTEEARTALACWHNPDTPACMERLP
jgi:hypothetical protein